jgi:hypothetical protein
VGGLHGDMTTSTYTGPPFIGSPFTADDEIHAPLFSLQPLSRNSPLKHRQNGLTSLGSTGFQGKKMTLSHDGPLGGETISIRGSQEKSFKNGLNSIGKKPRTRQLNIYKTQGNGGGGWTGNIVRAEQSPVNMYHRQNSHDSSVEDHVYLDI